MLRYLMLTTLAAAVAGAPRLNFLPPTIRAATGASCALNGGQDCYGSDLSDSPTDTPEQCCDLCASTAGCAAFTHNQYNSQGQQQGTCYMKTACATPQGCGTCTAGTLSNPPAPTPPPVPTPAPPTPPPTPMPPAKQRAAKLVAQMSNDQKCSLLNGVGWSGYNQQDQYYVGNTVKIGPLGDGSVVPSINMQDAAQGFRTTDTRMYGTVTSWPCVLGATSTWDRALMREWGVALGAEHRGKGANTILGPSVNVHRVARGGRNAEYISGEDPVLGAALTREYVGGVQSQGVMAVVKHYVLNNQETNRGGVSSNAADRTLYEVYYPPFEAAVEAGVAAAMCSYNLINGTHACGSDHALNDGLKGAMGFGGFVMSDWWALHDDAGATAGAAGGVDQDMPGTDGHFDCGKIPSDSIDGMATRVLTSMASVGVLDNVTCTAGADCGDLMYSKNVTSDAHAALARRIAAEGAVLLANRNGTLPIRVGGGGQGQGEGEGEGAAPVTIAVVGSACDAANDIDAMTAQWNLGNYYVLGGSGRVISPNTVSIAAGLQAAVAGTGATVKVSAQDDVSAALAAISGADYAIACGATTSTEGDDRPNLDLDQADFLNQLTSQAPAGTNLVVLMNTPGAVLTPWRGAPSVGAIAQMNLAGQATGLAWADVLLGQTNPSGKLPVTFPAQESDTVEPCGGDQCDYDERLLVGYRAFDANGVEPAFPFGHGLSYTTFAYSGVEASATKVSVTLKNTGEVAGAEVVQLYLAFPASAGEPPQQLKGFEKVTLAAGASKTVEFALSARDLSVYSDAAAGWQPASGAFGVRVGSSSRDIRANATFTV